ncbi:MAG: SDR family NAD(P)-dependent oxidoreductase [Candidatus Hodarchaeota archaeon]
MEKKLCIVTGANRGIGRAIAEDIARQEHQVVLVCRNEDSGKAVLNKLRTSYGNSTTELVIGDLSSIAKTKALAKILLERYPRINVLIHNAGIWPSKLIKNEDGLELAFTVNYLSLFYLTHLLLDRLKESAPVRIVLVSAALYSRGSVNMKLTPWGGDFHRLKTYMNTKLCGILFMRKLAPQLDGTGITINAVHPGVIRTGLGNFGGPLGLMLRIVKRMFKAPEYGAKGPIHLALSPDIQSNGCYYDKLQENKLGGEALDDNLADQLWHLSKQLCGIHSYFTKPGE